MAAPADVVSKKTKARRKTKAEKADKHHLYEQAVQCVESEIDFIDETFTQLRSREARLLREDFCGTANTSCEWVRRRADNHAISVDLDQSVLDWGRENNLSRLPSEAAARIELVNDNVLTYTGEPVDAALAMNFSYYCFKDRVSLRNYFSHVRECLVDDGILFMDAYGGYESFSEMEEPRKCKGFTYVWDQAQYDPITGDMRCNIHFRFRDGSSLENAFSYEWRLWTLPEIRELLIEAGFSKVTVYWDSTEDGDGEYEPAEHGDADAGWICYIVSEK